MTVASIKGRITDLLTTGNFRKYFLNTLWLFLDSFFKLGVAFIVSIYVTRHLGPEQFGILSYALGFVGIFTAFTQMGLKNTVVRDLVRGKYQQTEILGTAFSIRTIGGFVTLLLIAIVSTFNNDDVAKKSIILIIASAEIFKGFEVISLYYQSRIESKYVAKASLFQGIALSIFKLLLVYFEASLILFAVTYALDVILGDIKLIFTYVKNTGSLLKWKFVAPIAKQLLSDSWPLIFYVFALNIQSRIDQVMLGNMIGKDVVGYYSVALRMIEVVAVIPMVIARSFTPAITKAKNVSELAYKNRLKEYYRLMFVLFLLTSIPLFFFAEVIVVSLYGEVFREAGILLSLFSIRMLFIYMGIAKSSYITNENLFKYTMVTAFAGAISNIAINYMLIPLYGAVGAIIATILSFSISIFAIDFFYFKTRSNIILMFKSMFSFWKISFDSAANTFKNK